MKFKKSILLVSITAAIFSLVGCKENPEKTIIGSWKSTEIVPLEEKNATLAYIPASTTIKISEKYIHFMDKILLEHKMSGSGNSVKISIKEESLLSVFPDYESMLSAGSMKKNHFENLQQIKCSLKDSSTMECNLAEFWTASTYMTYSGEVKQIPVTYSENRYTPKDVLFTRIAGE